MMTIHEVLHLFADAINVTEHVRGDVHAAIDAHAGQVATVATDVADVAKEVADTEQTAQP